MNEVGKLEISWIQGFTRGNVEFVDNKTVCYACGNHICFLNLETKTRSVFQSPGRGVGALTASADRGAFAFSEKKLSPSVFLYSFPGLNPMNELKGSAELDYTCLTLSDGGPYLGCCSSFPDYSITVWNWENAEVICKQSQAGHDILSLKFNPMNWLQLCALGTATLNVWTIERCGSFQLMKPRIIQLPPTDGSSSEKLTPAPAKNPNCDHSDISRPAISEHPKGKPISYESPSLTRATVTASAVCWTPTSQLYVGCAEGYLLLVDLENLSTLVLFNPAAADAVPELRNFHFQALTLTSNGVMAVGKESVMHFLQIRGNQTSITQTWQLERPVSTSVLSPDNDTILLTSNTGQMYLLNPAESDGVDEVLDVLSGNFLTAALLHADKNICVSLRECGVLQLWSSDGAPLGSLALETEVTSLACCPIARYAAVGTASGKVLFVDLNDEKRLRPVHEVYLCHTAVERLVFDQEGHYLFCTGSDLYLYVLDSRPSTKFSVIGFLDVPGCVLSLSTQCLGSEEVKVLALCASHEDKKDDGRSLMLSSLPFKSLAGSDCVDRHGCLHIQKVFRYEGLLSLTSIALGLDEVFAYCHRNKSIQRFLLPQDTDSVCGQQMVQLNLKDEVKGHPLGPVSLLLSPDCLWLASGGQDGLLRIRPTASMGQYCELWSHSCHLGGVRSVAFSEDARSVVTTGFGDGSLVCTNLRFKDQCNTEDIDFTECRQAAALSLKISFDSENPVLMSFPALDNETFASCKKTDEPEVTCATSIDVTEQDEGYLPPASHTTWLESRQEEIVKEDDEQYSETKETLKKTVRELRETIQKMLRENESLPEELFNLDVEDQRRLEAMVEHEAERVKAELELDVVEKWYLRDVLKRECWDSVRIKCRRIKAFHSEMTVKNYPLKERTEKESKEIHRVQNMRKIEKAACKRSGLKKISSEREEEQEEEGREAESAALSGSFSAQLGYSSPYVYNQFSLQSIEQRINQIILLQDLIHGIKMEFNSDFEALHRLKAQELRRVQEKNKNIRELMLELDIKQELWEPRLTDGEWPERLLTVDDSEIKAEKYLTPEQKKQEEKHRLEKESRLTAQSDDSRERALDDMMEGVLEVKKVDILKMEIPPPEFVLTKPDVQWSEEDKKDYKEYEKSLKDLSEEKEKYKRALEIGMKKLQESIKEATEKFDEALTKLFEKKVKCTVAIYQEELKITYLADSVLTVEEMKIGEQELMLKLEQALVYKMKTEKDLMRHEDMVEEFQYAYESVVAEDKGLDKEFRKSFADLPNHVVDQLYKLFKRRPRVQRLRAQAENASNVIKQHPPNGSQVPDGLSQMLAAMEELDALENMPEELNPSVWERFCFVRKTKVESEQRMKIKALNLAEMQAFLQRRRDEDKSADEEIKKVFEAVLSLQNKRNNCLTNTPVQVILKQEQVETCTTDWTADTAETDFILFHRSVVDNLRKNIRTLAEQKVATMEARREVRKAIIQLEWEQRVMKKKIKDLDDKKKDIKMLRLSEDQQDMKCRSKKDQNARMLEKISTLEKSIAFMKTTHQRSVQQRMKRLKHIKKKIAKTTESSAALEEELPGVQVTVAELRHIYEAAATEENEAAEREERHRELIHRCNLEDLARVQSQELELLWKELERLKRKNFPSLDELKHNY